MPQMTLTAEEAKMVRAHRKAMEARRWYMEGVGAAITVVRSMMAASGGSVVSDHNILANLLALGPPRDLGSD